MSSTSFQFVATIIYYFSHLIKTIEVQVDTTEEADAVVVPEVISAHHVAVE